MGTTGFMNVFSLQLKCFFLCLPDYAKDVSVYSVHLVCGTAVRASMKNVGMVLRHVHGFLFVINQKLVIDGTMFWC